MNGHPNAFLVVLLTAVSLGGIAATVTAVALGGGDLAAAAVTSVVVGSYLIVRVRGNNIGLVLAAFGAAAVASDFANAMVGRLVDGAPSATTVTRFVAVIAGSVFVMVGTMGSTLLVIFPTGSPKGRWVWLVRGLLGVGTLGLVTGAVWSATQPLDVVTAAILSTGNSPNPAELAAAVTFIPGLPLALCALVVRFRGADHTVRLQIRWLLFAAVVLFTSALVANMLDAFESPVAVIASGLGFLLFPTAIAIAITRYHLYDIDRIVSRTVTYALVIGVIALIFLSIAVLPTVVIGSAETPPWLIAASTLLAFVSFSPLRRRVQRLVDRRFNRLRYDSEAIGNDLASKLQDAVDPSTISISWLAAAQRSLQPVSAAVWVRDTR